MTCQVAHLELHSALANVPVYGPTRNGTWRQSGSQPAAAVRQGVRGVVSSATQSRAAPRCRARPRVEHPRAEGDGDLGTPRCRSPKSTYWPSVLACGILLVHEGQSRHVRQSADHRPDGRSARALAPWRYPGPPAERVEERL